MVARNKTSTVHNKFLHLICLSLDTKAVCDLERPRAFEGEDREKERKC